MEEVYATARSTGNADQKPAKQLYTDHGTTITEEQLKQLPAEQQSKLMELLTAINGQKAIT